VPKLKEARLARKLTDRFVTVGGAGRRSDRSTSKDTEPREPHFEGSLPLMRIRTLIAAAFTTAVVVLAAIPAAEAGQRNEMVGAINFVRGWGHHDRLRYSKHLSGGAAAWARHLMRRDVMAHSARARQRGEGEIIEWHTGSEAKINQVVMEWLRSPGHRRVMLAGRFRRAGAGKAVGELNGRRSVIWVVRFSR
jgi:uncharacterized protein YkwD